MTSWKRDFASGLVVLGPILVTLFVLYWLYGYVAALAPGFILPDDFIVEFLGNGEAAQQLAGLIRVLITMTVLVILVFAIGYLMRTTVGDLFERLIDNLANRLPGLRVVYNASKMAAQTAVGEQETLQEPVKLEVWDDLRMTAFRTGKTAEDGRQLVFIPTSPNITSGFVVEVEPDNVEELDENVEEALTRVLSAGFGDSDRDGPMGGGIPIDVIDEGTTTTETKTDDD
ncbi:hypothetical protein Halru_2251 [Halovivax ruber XH-70]|uniref:DUF502 domain-containing protein n=1 Tax=Halovivax ruber (strain DSM 18193 / JCM 13892 / XH-70) TaxID=797302 RepID=L0IFW0_HALRX|nr:DUF502 domain-containing protein [Halovivax ruber]AGB16837.1 hypothetical protein Halru_2251 [Halovivax ruber XH-70]